MSAYERVPTEDASSYPPPSSQSKRTARAGGIASRKLFLYIALLCIVALSSYKAGQWSTIKQIPDRNEREQGEENNQIEKPQVPSNDTDAEMHSMKSVGYFTNWGIYGRKFPPTAIPVQDVTHILYAFADIKADGAVALSDPWSDEQIHYPGDSWNDQGNNLYGNFKAIYKLKKAHRHLKLLLSIGGWTYSPKFHPVVVSPELRRKFAETSVRLLEDYGLDGLDVDYEYPSNGEQARGYVELLKEMRHALDEHARKKGINYRFLLTIASPCGPDNYKKLLMKEMDQYLDFWNLMAYDYSGSWDQIANHQANVFGGPISTSEAVQYYESHGVPRHKMVIGLPLYGRSFMNTDGPGHPFSGIGQGTWEQGVYDYRALPLPGAHMFRDERALASWSYDYSKKEMVSFDSEEAGRWKAEWIRREGLGGAMYWELSGDKGGTREGMEGGPGKDPQPGQSLVSTVNRVLGSLDGSENWLVYEGSKFDNLRNGME